jgi:putative SOS response-associated peptidase YedK
MCGRYLLTRAEKLLAREFEAEADPELALVPHYNIAPSQQIVTVRQDGSRRLLSTMRWGLVPSWAKDPAIGHRMVNARSESVLEKPAFREAFQQRRCLIPADGFYEWKKLDSKSKRPLCIGMKDGSVFAFAGIWERWKPPQGAVIESCSILTTSPNDLLQDIHDRMPVILPRDQYALWLTAPPNQARHLTELMVPYEADKMRRYEVSTLVNSPKNDLPACAEPLPPA